MRTDKGFTIIEVLVVTVILGLLAAIAVPALIRAKQSGDEAAAIGSVRAVNNGQAAYASTCGGGGFAQNNADLAKPPNGGAPFISPDLEMADVVGHSKSGYSVTVSDNHDPSNRDVLAAATTCNGSTASSRLNYFVIAVPVIQGETGVRSFGSDRRGTIFFNTAGALPNPIPNAFTDIIQ